MSISDEPSSQQRVGCSEALTSLIHSCTVIDNCSYLELHCKSMKVNEARVKFKHDSWDVLDTVR